jgi:pyridoxamine 5'-phosphate oxidase
MRVDPIVRFQRWFREAQRADIALPEAMALATATRAGRPSVRYVLLKRADADGFVFFTDGNSRKGRELIVTRRAALVLYWDPIRKQVRVEGRVAPVPPAESDAYWATRARASQLAAMASAQSETLASWEVLQARWRRLQRRYRGKPVPRPPEWIGFRVVPRSIEFWTRRAHRLHHRELFVRTRRGWRRRLLQP